MIISNVTVKNPNATLIFAQKKTTTKITQTDNKTN